MMGGWKTWLSVFGFAVLAVVDFINGDNGSGMVKVTTALGFLGLGHKIEKAGSP
jgi:hypothetical protein